MQVEVRNYEELTSELIKMVKIGNIVALASNMGIDATEPIARGKVLRAMANIEKDARGEFSG